VMMRQAGGEEGEIDKMPLPREARAWGAVIEAAPPPLSAPEGAAFCPAPG